jgi:hypothetical protein
MCHHLYWHNNDYSPIAKVFQPEGLALPLLLDLKTFNEPAAFAQRLPHLLNKALAIKLVYLTCKTIMSHSDFSK